MQRMRQSKATRMKIHCIPNDEHTMRVLQVRRMLCIGEDVSRFTVKLASHGQCNGVLYPKVMEKVS